MKRTCEDVGHIWPYHVVIEQRGDKGGVCYAKHGDHKTPERPFGEFTAESMSGAHKQAEADAYRALQAERRKERVDFVTGKRRAYGTLIA